MSNEFERAVGEHDVPIITLLFASLGPAVAWGTHFNLVYFLNTMFCITGRSGGALAIFGATAVFAIIALLAGWVAWRKWRALGNAMRIDDAVGEPMGRTSILLFIGMASSLLFTLFIVAEGLVPLFVRSCSLAA
jgi:hypothetical protein